MKQTNNGELRTFLQLLKSCTKIVIPKIQRDYAQGRKDPAGSNLCEEVRNNFVDSIKSALTTDSQLVLDYVYGSRDEANFFYPIDGQQRLTTIWLIMHCCDSRAIPYSIFYEHFRAIDNYYINNAKQKEKALNKSRLLVAESTGLEPVHRSYR